MRARQCRDHRINGDLRCSCAVMRSVEQHGPMRLHRPLRMAGGSRRVADGRERIRLDGNDLEVGRLSEQLVERCRAGDGLAPEHHRGQARDAGVERRLDLFRAADERLGATVARDVGHFGRRQHDVDGIDHGTGLERAVVADDPLPGVGRIERHTVARTHREPDQMGCQRARELVQLAETEGSATGHERHLVTEAPRSGGQHLSERVEHHRLPISDWPR